MVEAGDGWKYLHGGHLESGLSGDVWRFRVSESESGDNGGTVRALKLRWEQVWGGESDQEDGTEDAGSDGTDGSSSNGSSSGGESDEEREQEHAAAADGADAGAAPDAAHGGPHHAPHAPAAAALGPGGAGAPPPPPPPAFQAAMLAVNHGVLGAGFEEAAGVEAGGPRPRCAASWASGAPGTNKIFLFGGQGSENEFLDDLWCFHAGGRGECRWERLNQQREPRPTGGGGGGEGQGEEDADDNEGGGARGPWRVPEGRWGHTMVGHRGMLYMFGGSSPGKAYGGLWRLDTSASPCVWSLMRPAGEAAETVRGGRPGARGGHSATVVKDTLYIFGGNILKVGEAGRGGLVVLFRAGLEPGSILLGVVRGMYDTV